MNAITENVQGDEGLEPTQPTQQTEPIEQPTKPDFLPDQYWDSKENQANLRGMVNDLTTFRSALSRKEQDVPSDPSGYGFSDIDLPDDIINGVRSFAHKLGLSKFQADQLFGEEAEKIGEMFNQYNARQQEIEAEKADKAYLDQEIRDFGGVDKVKEAVRHMDNMFTVAKNKGILNDDEIVTFKHSAIRDAKSLQIFDKLVNLFDNLNSANSLSNQAAGVAQASHSNLSPEEIVDSVVSRLRKARNQAERDKIYESLGNLNH